jgi:hypothetical protein
METASGEHAVEEGIGGTSFFSGKMGRHAETR